MKELKIKYQAVAKWYIDNRINKDVTKYMNIDLKNYNTYEECLDNVKNEIKRRCRTEQPIHSYKIYKVYYEVVDEVLKDE